MRLEHEAEKEASPHDNLSWHIAEQCFNAQLQSDLIAKFARETFPLLSSGEMMQVSIPANAIAHQGDNDTDGSTGKWSLVDIIGQHMRSQENNCDVGKPRIIIFCSSASRVIQIYRYLRTTKGNEYSVYKMFGKHIKLAEAADVLRQKNIEIAVGTPGRLNDLLNINALDLINISLVVIDTNFRDVKQRTIWDWKESREPLFYFIKNPIVRSMLDNGKLTILPF